MISTGLRRVKKPGDGLFWGCDRVRQQEKKINHIILSCIKSIDYTNCCGYCQISLDCPPDWTNLRHHPSYPQKRSMITQMDQACALQFWVRAYQFFTQDSKCPYHVFLMKICTLTECSLVVCLGSHARRIRKQTLCSLLCTMSN